jgi:hypothetical protein
MSANPAPFRFIAGDTLSLYGPVLSNGNAYSIAGWVPTCKLRRDSGGEPGELIANLSASVQAGGTALAVQASSADTSLWEPGLAWVDIRFLTPGGVTVTTPAVPFQILRAASR